MKVSHYLNTEVVNYASYDNLRKIASYIDGQKNTSRKILYTVIEKNINTELKVAQMASKMAEFTQYLHGDSTGAIVTMAKNYTGTNNLPLLTREGNFGTRFKQDASAPRYIYTMKEKYLDSIFSKEDNGVLIEQHFEGDRIEPRFYVPNLPMLAINGSNGVTPGYRQYILPRNVDDIKDYIKRKLNGEDVSHLTLKPHYNGFTGEIVQGITSSKWEIRGSFEISNTYIIIKEVPPSYDLKGYLQVLDDLVDKKVIRSYRDKSENDRFHFEVLGQMNLTKMPKEKILEKLKLVVKVTEFYNAIDENNRIRLFEGIHDMLDAYIKIKLEYNQLRKLYQLERLKERMTIDASRYIFIKNINDGVILINRRSKQDIIDQMSKVERIVKRDGSFDYLLNIPIYRLTVEEENKIREGIMKLKEEYQLIQSMTVESIWLEDIANIKVE